jgi:hypothetical protein
MIDNLQVQQMIFLHKVLVSQILSMMMMMMIMMIGGSVPRDFPKSFRRWDLQYRWGIVAQAKEDCQL